MNPPDDRAARPQGKGRCRECDGSGLVKIVKGGQAANASCPKCGGTGKAGPRTK